MKISLKRADSFLLLILSAVIPAFYLFLKTKKYTSLNSDSLQILKDASVLFLFFIGSFLNSLVKKRIICFCLLFMLSAASFVLLPETVLLFSPILFLLRSLPLIKGEEPKSLYALAFYSQSLFPAFGLYLFKTGFFLPFLEQGREYKVTFALIFAVMSLVFIPIFILAFIFEKKKGKKETFTFKKKRQSVGFKIEVIYLTEVISVFLLNIFFIVYHHFSQDLFWFSLCSWIVAWAIMLFEMHPRQKRVLKD